MWFGNCISWFPQDPPEGWTSLDPADLCAFIFLRWYQTGPSTRGDTIFFQSWSWCSGAWDRHFEQTNNSVSVSFSFKCIYIGVSDILGVLEHDLWSPSFSSEWYGVLFRPVNICHHYVHFSVILKYLKWCWARTFDPNLLALFHNSDMKKYSLPVCSYPVPKIGRSNIVSEEHTPSLH